ncbi:MAG: flagellar L-ring protein FlgH [Candidatus Hydrogenedentes bacterium]|nr:flagellar L-ring protein FlgH [Candidatus Hydrogenedentota bacterium]
MSEATASTSFSKEANVLKPIAVAFVVLTAMSAAGDSLFNAKGGANGTLVSQKKARFEIGDIITVLVRENIDAVTESNTDARKQVDNRSDAPLADNEFLTANPKGKMQFLIPERLPNWDIHLNKDQRTRGETERNNKLVTTVTCTVVQVLDNETIAIEGNRQVTVNREDSTLVVSGIARAKDVTPANTLESGRIGNAVIQLKGQGPLWNNQRRGLLTKVFDWVSPF